MMKRTFYQSLMAIMLLCSFAFLSCNNKKANSETTNVESVDTETADDIDSADDDSPNEMAEEWLDRLAWLLQGAEELAAEAEDDIYAGRQLDQASVGASEAIETLEAQKHGMNRYQRQRYEQLVKRYKKIFGDY